MSTIFNRVHLEKLEAMLDMSGSTKTKFLGFLLTRKDSRNRIFGTYDELARQADVPVSVVKTLMPRLIIKGFVRKMRMGTFMVNPKIIKTSVPGKNKTVTDIWNGETR